MKKISYTARDADGKLVTGEIVDVTDTVIAAKKIREKKLTPISIRLVSQKPWWYTLSKINLTKEKVKSEAIYLFCRQMFTMLKSGIPITNSLIRLAESNKNATLKKILFEMSALVSSGQSLSIAFSQYSNIFPAVMQHIISVGESTGKLDESFYRVGEYIKLEIDTISRIKKVLRYPIIVICAMVIAVIVINIFVIPAFTSLFESYKAELPIITKILVACSKLMINNGILLLIGLIAFFSGFKYFISQPYGRKLYDTYILRLPIFGKILYKIILFRFARTMLMVLQTGVPLTNGIEMTANSVGNLYVKEKILILKKCMESGESLANSLRQIKLFPKIALQMLIVGEESGKLEHMMEEVALYYESEVDYQVDSLGDLIEPILLIFIGVLVLFVSLGVFLPIWEIGAVAR